MADKVSFTNFGEKKKVRKVKRRRTKPKIDAEKLLDEVLAAKKMAEEMGVVRTPFKLQPMG